MPALPPNRPGCPAGRRTRPLPDPAAVRMCLIPDPAPPYDGEALPAVRADVGLATPPGHPGAGQASPLAPGRLAGPQAAGRGTTSAGPTSAGSTRAPATPSGPTPAPASPSGPTPAPAGSAPGWPGRFAQVLAETLAGSRPPRQIVPWTTERVRDRIQRLGAQLSSPQQPRVRRVVTFHPAADVLEMTVVVGFGTRVRALAVRLEREAGQPAPAAGGHAAAAPRWRCTAVEAA